MRSEQNCVGGGDGVGQSYGGEKGRVKAVESRAGEEPAGGWQNISVEEGLADDMFWQLGFSNYSIGRNHNDELAIYLDAEAKTLVYAMLRRWRS